MRQIPHSRPGARYLAVYEIETEDIEKTMEAHRKNLEEKYGLGRSSDLHRVRFEKALQGRREEGTAGHRSG